MVVHGKETPKCNYKGTQLYPGWDKATLSLLSKQLVPFSLLSSVKPQTSLSSTSLKLSPAIISARSQDGTCFYNSLQSFVDRFPLATRLPGNVFQQDLPLHKLISSVLKRECVYLAQLPILLPSVSWLKENYKIDDLSGSLITGTLCVLNFCLCKRSTIMATLLIPPPPIKYISS